MHRAADNSSTPEKMLVRGIGLTLMCAVLAIGLMATGCAGYRLGPSNRDAAGAKSVQVNGFLNQTLQPRLTDAVTQQLRRELQRDGTFALATAGDGDIEINGTITRYERIELSFARNDVLTVRDYRLMLTADVIAKERGTGKILLQRPITGVTLIRVGSDLTSAERQALPLLAGDLARNVASALSDGDW